MDYLNNDLLIEGTIPIGSSKHKQKEGEVKNGIVNLDDIENVLIVLENRIEADELLDVGIF